MRTDITLLRTGVMSGTTLKRTDITLKRADTTNIETVDTTLETVDTIAERADTTLLERVRKTTILFYYHNQIK